ncbi:hypothetical protein UPYG_G00331260, partial [Umbra pygmaea]
MRLRRSSSERRDRPNCMGSASTSDTEWRRCEAAGQTQGHTVAKRSDDRAWNDASIPCRADTWAPNKVPWWLTAWRIASISAGSILLAGLFCQERHRARSDMLPPPPPAPPPPPPPCTAPPPQSNGGARNALLADIQKGARLKKVAQVNDRSAPVFD